MTSPMDDLRQASADVSGVEVLSPQAQAVLHEFWQAPVSPSRNVQIAAALRAAADQCKIEWNYHPDYLETESVVVVSDLLAIAAELEGAQ